MAHHAVKKSTTVAGFVACAACAALVMTPASAQAAVLDQNLVKNSTVLVVGGTDDPNATDMTKRVNAWFPGAPTQAVKTPATFGIGSGKFVLPIIRGDGSNLTYNASTAVGAANVKQAVLNASGPISIATISQGSAAVGNAIYLIHRDNPEQEGKIVGVILAADPRFPNTGLESLFPSFIPGLNTNGPRDPSATGSIPITSPCIIGDTVCGFSVYNGASYFYLLPGFLAVHSNAYGNIQDYTVVKSWTEGSTTYQVVDSGQNPWGMLLRQYGIPVPKEFDAALSKLVPVPIPGERTKVLGQDIPLPREIQVALYNSLGLKVPVTDPDQIDKQNTPSPAANSVTSIPSVASATRSVTVPAAVATGTVAPTTLAPTQASSPSKPGVTSTASEVAQPVQASSPAPAPKPVVVETPSSPTPTAPALGETKTEAPTPATSSQENKAATGASTSSSTVSSE